MPYLRGCTGETQRSETMAGKSVVPDDGGDGGGGGNPPRTAAKRSELMSVMAISERVRRALECPVCLQPAVSVSCFCPNGHVVCDDCLFRMQAQWMMDGAGSDFDDDDDGGGGHRCPLCRARMTSTADATVTAVKVNEILNALRVVCVYRPFGCGVLLVAHKAADHEARCRYAPRVQCLVPACRWQGPTGRLFGHVERTHGSGVAVTAPVSGGHAD